jgi:pseudaminic acid biosynthesis-associated methylase
LEGRPTSLQARGNPAEDCAMDPIALELDQVLPAAQLAAWQGEFGRAYTERNVLDRRTRAPAFREMLAGLALTRVLEVGCNRGHNLATLAEELGIAQVLGVEPGEHALQLARAASPRASALAGRAEALPFRDAWFDLVFTCGVLIHVPPAGLDAALAEIVRCSRRYVLAIEYFAESEEQVEYRGHRELLWKRNYAAEYLRRNPNLHVLRQGYWDRADGFDRSHWWLMERAPTRG